jgi:subtilisin family serine protease
MTELLPAWADHFVPPRPVRTSGLPVSREWALGDGDGTGVRVAIVDSGVDVKHPAVAGPFGEFAALSLDPVSGEIMTVLGPHDDLYGHGTACASIVRQHVPNCEILSVRVLGERLTGKGPVFAAGLRWALAAGARVLNLSLSSSKPAMAELFREVADEAAHAGAILVCAMNNIPALTFPSQFASVISVAAAAQHELLISDRPPADFGAPGIDVEVAWLDGGTLTVTGNSFAAPWVAGLATRIIAAHPDMRPYEVKAVLRAIAANAVPDECG